MKKLRAYLIGLGLVLGGATVALAGASTWVSSLTGPMDISQTWGLLGQQITNYVSFAEAGEVGELAFSPSSCVSGTSMCVIMPNGDKRYIQTSATP